jgi:outer membrane protein
MPFGLRRSLVALSSVLALEVGPVHAADLMDVWRAAQQQDLDYVAAGSARQAGEARRAQAGSLWLPSVQLTGTAGRATSETTANGAQFSAPGFGETSGVNFNTSVTNGTMGRCSIEARQPLLSRERQAQSRQLALSADVADLEWQNAQQTLMLTTAQRYFEVVLASESLRVLQQQDAAVKRALTEARDRHALGDIPVTGTYEASARAEAIRAQILATETDLQLKQIALSDVTGLRPEAMNLRFPTNSAALGEVRALDRWLAEAADRNPLLRMQAKRTEVATEEAAKFSVEASPKIDLVAQAGQDRLSGSGDYGSALNNSTGWMVGVQVSVPLYTGGYRSARQEEALHLADKARTDAERSRQRIALQTRAAWMGLTVGAGRIAALAEALRANQARLDATRVGFQAGDRTTLDVLNAENDAANAELALLQARVESLMDRLRLAALSGQLDETQLQLVNATLAGTPSR